MKSKKGRPTPRPPRRNLRRIVHAPLYGLPMVLSVSDNIVDARTRENAFLGEDEDLASYDDCAGLTAYWGQRFGIFFNFQTIDHGIIAHELFHVTHRILHYVGIRFRPANSEPFTYLNQFLTVWTYQQLAQAKIKVSL